MTHLIAISALILCFLSGCDNDRSLRLTSDGYCRPDQDSAAFSLSKKEIKILKSFELPDADTFTVTEFTSTITFEDDEENEVVISVFGLKTSENNFTVGIDCLRGTGLSTQIAPTTIKIPVTNKNNGFMVVQFTLAVNGKATISSELIDPSNDADTGDDETDEDAEEENAEDENTEDLLPLPFTSYYDQDSDETAVYEFKKLGKGQIPTYYLHHKSDSPNERALKISTRLTLQKK